MAPAGEPAPGQKPQPIGGNINMPLIFLVTTATLCLLFLLYRRANSIKQVLAVKLKTWTRQEGAVRLSEDDGPSSREFLDDDYIYDEDVEGVEIDRLQAGVGNLPVRTDGVQDVDPWSSEHRTGGP